MDYIFNSDIYKNDSKYIFCGSQNFQRDTWFINYPFGYIQAYKINNNKWWYINMFYKY
jgi:hypothetical protein